MSPVDRRLIESLPVESPPQVTILLPVLTKDVCCLYHQAGEVDVLGIEPSKPEATGLQPAETNQ